MPKMVELYCQAGEHKWERPSQRGRRPINCPDHQPDPTEVVVVNNNSEEPQHRPATFEAAWEAVQAHPDFKNCECGLEYGMTAVELKSLGAGCTAPRWVCPVLIAYRNRVK